MEMLPNLHTLRLSFFENPKSAESQSQDIQQKPTQDEISRIQDLGLRVLTVAFTTVPQQISVLNILLQHCPLLESLEICGLRDSGVMEHIIQLFQKNHFPYLKHFNIANLKSSDIEGEIVSKMIQGLGLYQNEDNGVRQHERIHPCRLEAFKILKFEKFTWSSAHSLLDYHKDTLTELEISPNHSIQFALFSLIASSLPNLVSMNVDVWIGPGSGSTSHDLESMDIAIKSNWKCLGLKRLLLSTMYRHEETWRSVVEECANQLFNQIAKLSRLREWSFVGSIDLLVASCPYLSKLSSLKELRSLTLNVDLDFPLGKEEAEWMLENWSKLIHVESIENPWDDELISPGPQYGHFEKTLLSQRPWLQITNRME
ncbi:hypothetical protein BGZ76_004067 [Entomortierella beljakovae]|nr:hypothetical protein BGZ76_004067 [Entomortierella beljakovae]